MDLQTFLEEKFKCWQPSAPSVVDRTKCTITLSWQQDEFGFITDQMLYKIEMKSKLPPWITVYSGGKTSSTIDNLPPRYPHRFRLKVILKATGVSLLSERAIQFYGNEESVYNKVNDIVHNIKKIDEKSFSTSNPDMKKEDHLMKITVNTPNDNNIKNKRQAVIMKRCWIETSWSPETWTSTDTDGTSAICFSMAVRCGYIKQVQVMLDERPELIGIVNATNGLTPLATAVRKGDINTVRFLISVGAELDQRIGAGQTPLHIAVLSSHIPMVELLLEKGADTQARDNNGMLIEHYAVDSGSLDMLKFVLDRGGDVNARDNNGWTPLFRALCQDASTQMVQELVSRSSKLDVCDNAGLPMTSVAKLLKNRHDRSRDSILRLVDSQYPHEKALANFTRLTKKINHVHTLFK
ncbi:fibronectin type 3 and ankyrin repeat domains 1 protein [Galleria mellonella]|uniref:Fibronectin type 3 and ankyrin repeat domains 1 protein n=1 Tax=Galleria mellonella TaxID=7137 RepID=A0A6J1WR63_GALME|nr:fibronectin type 3 and ankyrin repeat domains 1 protein [Galleria mellonella]